MEKNFFDTSMVGNEGSYVLAHDGRHSRVWFIEDPACRTALSGIPLPDASHEIIET